MFESGVSTSLTITTILLVVFSGIVLLSVMLSGEAVLLEMVGAVWISSCQPCEILPESPAPRSLTNSFQLPLGFRPAKAAVKVGDQRPLVGAGAGMIRPLV